MEAFFWDTLPFKEYITSEQLDSGGRQYHLTSQQITEVKKRLQEWKPTPTAHQADLAGAIDDAKKAAEQGNPVAAYKLGKMYENGESVTKDLVEAVKWYREAAEQGPPVVQSALRSLYEGERTEYYIDRMADGPDAAQYALSAMYANGDGVKQDYVQAYMWRSLVLARLGGNVGELDDLSDMMTPKQIAEAKRLAAEWKPTPEEPPAPDVARDRPETK